MTRFIRARGRWLVLTVVGALLAAFAFPSASFADNPTGCDFASNGTTQSCSGPLSGSTFAGGDGNLLASPTTFGTTDWQNVAGLNAGFDLPSGTGDNAFGQGTKEDSAAVTVVSGSIPPNKSDLSRFYEASEFANSSNFLYLAWERTNVLGSANMDFEINQATTPSLGTPGAHVINRTAGDLLVTFDFTNGGGRPTLSLLFWVTSGSTSQCFSSNSLPCWGNHVTLNGTDSIGAVNNLDAVTDPLFPSSPNYINPVPALQFGETAINLTAAGVFSAGTCEAFGSVFLKSRASASFTAEVKDFVAPIPVNISNCGAIIVTKTAKNHNLGAGQHPLAGATFTVNGVSKTTGSNGTACFDGLGLGTAYTVTETAAPAGYAIDTTSKSVTPSAPASCTSGTPNGVTFTDTPLTDLSVSATSEVLGVTNSTISCVNSSNADVGNSPQGPGDPVTVTANGLKPGTYTCTVTIDP